MATTGRCYYWSHTSARSVRLYTGECVVDSSMGLWDRAITLICLNNFRCGGMNVSQKLRRITVLPEYLAVHKIGGTRMEMQEVIQLNNVSYISVLLVISG